MVPRSLRCSDPSSLFGAEDLFFCPGGSAKTAFPFFENYEEVNIVKEALNNILAAAKAELEQAQDAKALEDVRVRYLGKKGELTGVLKMMGKLSAEERPVMGQAANNVRAAIEEKLEETKTALKARALDARLDAEAIEMMQQNIRDYKRHELLAQRQEEKLTALQEIGKLYREMNQAMERWRVQSFLVRWANKEVVQAQIQRREAEKQNCAADLAATEAAIQALTAQIEQKEGRRRELELACAQSSVFQEEDRLRTQKQQLLDEQKKLMQDLQNLAKFKEGGQSIRT